MGANASAQGASFEGASPDVIELFFIKAGKQRTVRAGERLIRQNETIDSVFLITEGELLLKKSPTGSKGPARQVAVRGKGDLLGDLTFLLGGLPAVSVEAPPRATASVIDLKQERLLSLLHEDPQLAGHVFRLLGATLGERLTEISSSMRSSVLNTSHAHSSHKAHTILPEALDRSPESIARDFEVDSPMVLWCDCVITVEENSVTDSQASRGTLYLFESHLCIEIKAFGFSTRRKFALTDVLGLLRQEKGDDGLPPGLVTGRAGGKGGKNAYTTLEVQCKALSLTLQIPTAVFEQVAAELEEGRVAAIDMHTLEDESVRVEKMSLDDGPSPFPPKSSKSAKPRRGGAAWKIDTEVAALMKRLSRRGSLGRAPPPMTPRDAAALAAHAQQAAGKGSGGAKAARSLHEEVEALGALTPDQWLNFLQGAEQNKYRHGDKVIREGESTRALYQVVQGSLRVELNVKGRPQAVVVGRRHAGDLFGERSLLLGGNASASVVVDSEDATVIRLTQDFLRKLFGQKPELMGKFFCILATDQARRLQKLTIESDTPELHLPDGLHAPTDMDSLLNHPAYLTILHKFVSKMETEQAKASSRHGHGHHHHHKHGKGHKHSKHRADEEHGVVAAAAPAPAAAAADYVTHLAQLDFCTEVHAFRSEPDAAHLRSMAHTLLSKYLGKRASRPISSCVSADHAADIDAVVNGGGASGMAASYVRTIFDGAYASAVAALEAGCLQPFLSSPQYNYVLALVLKVEEVPSIGNFKATRVLGQGGFGQVLEVVKRDCGKHYAMKVMRKEEIISAFKEDEWKSTVLLERQLQGELHHPLIVNLAYSFQNPGYLVLVMDACPGGDLSVFALTAERLDPQQVKFVGSEVTCVMCFMHSRNVLYRDLKPENLLLDSSGHVRLIDFGLALIGEDAVPTSDEQCGTPCYMAPEVKYVGRGKYRNYRYGAAADWYTLGVLMYELSEQNLPFGEDPQFSDHKMEWRRPKLLDSNGRKDDRLADLIKGLLEWKPDRRLGGGKEAGSASTNARVLAHRYWGAPEWDLVGARRMPSPLAEYVAAKTRAKPTEAKLKKAQRAAVETAVKMADSDATAEAAQAAQAAAKGSGGKEKRKEKKEKRKSWRKSAKMLMAVGGGGGGGGGGDPPRGGMFGALPPPSAAAIAGASAKEAARAHSRNEALTGAQFESLQVAGWDFVSPHAIETEYVETLASNVSLL